LLIGANLKNGRIGGGVIRGYKRSLGQSIVRHASAIGGIAALVIGIISVPAFWFGEPWRAEYGGWAVLNGTYWIAILYLIWLILTRPAPDFLGLPRARACRSSGLLIVEHSPWLSLGVMTAIYIMEDQVERLVCVGEVINVQSNGLVQIKARYHDQGYSSVQEAWQTLERTDKELILVKPGLYQRGT
jgi:hypothetical protein